MKKVMIIVMVAVMALMPVMGAEAHEIRGKITFRDVVTEIQEWELDEEVMEHVTSDQTSIDYENEEYRREIYFDDDCDVAYACIAAHTWTSYENDGPGEVWVYAVSRDGVVEEETYTYDEFAEEFGVWGSEE